MDIIIGFDGVCVYNGHLNQIRDVKNAPFVLDELVQAGHFLVLETRREGEFLQEAVSWFRERGLKLSKRNINNDKINIDFSNSEIPTRFNKYVSDYDFMDWNNIKKILISKNIL